MSIPGKKKKKKKERKKIEINETTVSSRVCDKMKKYYFIHLITQKQSNIKSFILIQPFVLFFLLLLL